MIAPLLWLTYLLAYSDS